MSFYVFFFHRSFPLMCFKSTGFLKKKSLNVGVFQVKMCLVGGRSGKLLVTVFMKLPFLLLQWALVESRQCAFALKEPRNHRVNVELAQFGRIIYSQEGTRTLTLQQSGEMASKKRKKERSKGRKGAGGWRENQPGGLMDKCSLVKSDPELDSWNLVVEGESQFPQVVLQPPHICLGTLPNNFNFRE